MEGVFSRVELSWDGGEPVEADLESLRFRHAIAELYEIDLVVGLTDGPELEDAVGAALCVTLPGVPEWSLPQLEGTLWSVELLSIGETGLAHYALRIAPPARLLGERDDHRIFQNLTAAELVTAVVGGCERCPRPSERLLEPHAAHEFVVQYGESDLAFVERIAADDGITLLHDPRDAGRMVLLDDTSRLDRSAALTLLCSYEMEGRVVDGRPRIRDVEAGTEVRTAKVVVGDYDPNKPRHVLTASAADGREGSSDHDGQEHYAFSVGTFGVEAMGAQRAKRMLEERRVGARVLSGRVDFPIAAGQLVRLVGHRRARLDADYLVLESRFVVERGGERSSMIRAIPADASFRPRRRPKPIMAGTQTATVVGAPGETVDVDGEGRVEVAFHWDRRRPTGPGASRRVRVAQAWAGSGHGMFAAPRVGDEVIVAFTDGDPDQPIVVGQVHNAARPTPLGLPDSKTQAVWRSQTIGPDGAAGFHHILMEDAAGRERLELRSQRDFVAKTLRNEDVSVGSSAARSVGGDESVTVGGGREVTVGEDQQIVVQELSELRAKTIRSVAQEETTIVSESLSLAAGSRSDQTTKRHTLENEELVVESKETSLFRTKRLQIIAEEVFEIFLGAFMLRVDSDGIVLNGPGATVQLDGTGITMSAAGVIDIQGSLVKINS